MSGCVKELVPEDNGYQPKVVLWAMLSSDSVVKVITSGNRGLSDKDVVNIPAIDMFLYENDIMIDKIYSQSISSDTQSHYFDIKPKSDNTYTIKLFNQSIEITGIVKLPQPLLVPEMIKLSQGENAQLEYTLKDDINFEDAYQFDVIIYQIGTLTDTSDNSVIDINYKIIKKYDRYDEPTLNYNLLGLNNLAITDFTFPVNDNLFNGKKKTFLFTVQNPVTDVFIIPRTILSGPPVSDQFKCRRMFIVIKCRKITPEYYKFLISENKNSSIFGTPYFNPTNVYTNITGGLGLVSGMDERHDTIWIRK